MFTSQSIDAEEAVHDVKSGLGAPVVDGVGLCSILWNLYSVVL